MGDAAGSRQFNPVLKAKGISVLRDTHGKSTHLTADEIDVISVYMMSLQ